jgi:hypothetical protein
MPEFVVLTARRIEQASLLELARIEPTNEGRHNLFGNVGYRLIGANIEELLRQPSAAQAR